MNHMHEPSARYVLPQFTERTSAGSRTLDPYAKLLEERIVFLGTPVDDTSANDVMAQFMHLEYLAPDRDISLYINSPGGSFSAMTAIYDTMRFVTCEVETICLGQAASAAAVLLAAGTPGKRSALPGARVLDPPAFPVRAGARTGERSRHSGRGVGPGPYPAGRDARTAHRTEPGASRRGHRAGQGPGRPSRPGIRAGGPDRAQPQVLAPRPRHEVSRRCFRPNCLRCPP